MYLIGLLLWTLVAGVLAWAFAHLITYRAKASWPRWMTSLFLSPLLFVAPLADEIVGRSEFDRLCEESKEVAIYGIISVGEELYTPDGKWRGSDTGDSPLDLEKVRRKWLQWEPPTITHLQLAIPIRQYEHQILDARSGKVVAQWRSYGTSGGWLSQHFETPFLVRSTCSPQVVRDSQIERKLLHFNSPRGIR